MLTMETFIAIIVSITLAAILGSVYLEIRRQIKPRIKVYFPDGSTQASYKAKEEASVTIHIKNIGRYGFSKPCATELRIWVYTLPDFSLRELRWSSGSSPYARQAPSGGIFGGMQYVGDETSLSLFYKEEETITVAMQMPEKTGRYTAKVALQSAQGDLGIHELRIIVS